MRRAAAWLGWTALAAAVLAAGFTGAPGGLALAAAAGAAAAGWLSAGRLLPAILFGVAVTGGLPFGAGPPGSYPWPLLLVLGFAAGEAFARLTATQPLRIAEPVAEDRVLRALAALWSLSALVAAASAQTLWALARGLTGRVVNIFGMTDIGVRRDTVLSLAAVLSGVAVFALVRRAEATVRRRAVTALLAGASLSGLVAALQSLGLFPAPRRAFWITVGRFQGLSSDPNALGVLLGLALLPAAAGLLQASGRARVLWAISTAALIGGLAASGSRSGFIVAVAGALLLPLASSPAVRRRVLPAVAAVALAVAVWLALPGAGGSGSLGRRILGSFDPQSSLAGRASSRPLLWRAALKAWAGSPIGGIGWNAYSWHLPNIARQMHEYLTVTDNPGNFYLQALCETGVAGALLVLGFLGLAAAAAIRASRTASEDGAGIRNSAIAASVLGFAAALAVGSHLLAAEVSAAFFAFAGGLVSDVGGSPVRPRRVAAIAGVLAAAAVLASLPVALSTRGADAAFRFSPRVGLYEPEPSPEGMFRWMGRRAAWKLFPGERRRLRLVYQSPGEEPERFRILSDGRVLYDRRMAPRRPAEVDLQAPPHRAAIFEFVNSSSFRPPADPRVLAMQVFELGAAR